MSACRMTVHKVTGLTPNTAMSEFHIEIEHHPSLSHSNVDGMSRPFCKQCFGKEPKEEWVYELERTDELTELLGVPT